MEVDAVGVLGLLAAHRELAFNQFDREVAGREAGHGKDDPQSILADPLDIVGGIALGILGQPVERALKLVEAQQQG